MSCFLEFPESLLKVEFCCRKDKQKILLDILTTYSEMKLEKIASLLEISSEKLDEISKGSQFL